MHRDFEIVEIDDRDNLYRRIVPTYVRGDGTISSAAFKVGNKPDPEISVDLGKLTTPENSLIRANRRSFGLGVLVTSLPRSIGFEVYHQPEHENLAHSLISGENDMIKCHQLAEATVLLIQPGSLQ